MDRTLYILSVEAKDLKSAMDIKGNERHGLHIRGKNGEIKTKKFGNVLDWSMMSEVIEETYAKTTRRKDFSFQIGKHLYTKWVINVKFTLSYKLFNKYGKTLYVRAGYNLHNNEIIDGICIKDGILIAIDTGAVIKNPQPKSVLGKHFDFDGKKYVQTKSIPTLMNCAELRRWAYSEGFYCDESYFSRLGRSSGSARVGNCLFVLHALSDKLEKYNLCGLPIFHNDDVDLASLEAYKGLNLSSMIGKITIQPHEILLIEDQHSTFEDKVVAVSAPCDELVTEEKVAKIKNSLWDGQSLLCSSLFEGYSDKSALILRNRFFKTAAFSCNIQKWFTDNGITDVRQLNGKTTAEAVEDIKLITTPSSLKYLKYDNNFEKWLQTVSPEFAVVKTEKPTKYFNSRMASSHYQLLNSVRLSYEDVQTFLEPSLAYIGLVRSDPDVLRYHIRFKHRDPQDTLRTAPIDFKSEAVFKLLGLNYNFSKTQIYKDFRSSLANKMVKNLKRGRVLVCGNYAMILGNPLEMLKEAIGQFDGTSSIPKGHLHCTNFEDGLELLGSRSPHILAGNILVAKNKILTDIEKYFKLSANVVCINVIGENILQRFSGSDQDGDGCLLTSHKMLIEKAKENYDRFLVPTCFVESSKVLRKYTDNDKADLDISTSVNLIGRVVNSAQVLNSLYWDKVNNGATYEEMSGLYESTSLLSIVSMIEIDKAKRSYPISGQKELDKLEKKYRVSKNGMTVKPSFFKNITRGNGYKLSDKILYEDFDTTMDYLLQIVTKTNFQQAQSNKFRSIPFIDIVKPPTTAMPGGSVLYRKDKIINTVREARRDIQNLYSGYKTKNKGEKRQVDQQVSERMQECVEAINKMSLCEHSMYLALKELDSKENEDIRDLLFDTLFSMPNDIFFDLIRKSSEPMYELCEDPDGDIDLYGFKYKKVLFEPKKLDFSGIDWQNFADFDDFLADEFISLD